MTTQVLTSSLFLINLKNVRVRPIFQESARYATYRLGSVRKINFKVIIISV